MFMNTFLTLIRRDMADNRGALIITPLVIAGIILLLGLFTTLTGTSRFGINANDIQREFSEDFKGSIEVDGVKSGVSRDAQGRIVIKTPEGDKTIDQAVGASRKEKLATAIPVGASFPAIIPIIVAAIIVLFLLAGSLYDERKDRTILFWKSLPVSDLSNTAAKMVSIIGVGFAIAFGIGVIVQLGTVLMASASLASVGVSGVPVGAMLANSAMMWLVGIVAILTYIGWAMPVYGWFLAVSAGSPKAPFVAAIVPIGLAPAIAGILGLPGDMDIWLAPLSRLVGRQAFGNVTTDQFENSANLDNFTIGQQTIGEITSSMASPSFWIGLVVAAALIYAASEIRRRRAL
jgi:ABC-2 type transport system permease protein